MSGNSNASYDDEIDLRDLIKVIFQRKKIILGLFLLGVIASLFFNFFSPSVYQSESLLRLGRAEKLAIGAAEAEQIILSRSRLDKVVEKLDLSYNADQLEKNIQVEAIKGTDLLEIKVKYSDADKAVQINRQVAEFVFAKGKDTYREKLSPLEKRLQELKSGIIKSKENIERGEQFLARFEQGNLDQQKNLNLEFLFLQNNLAAQKSYLNGLQKQKYELKTSLSNFSNFAFIQLPYVLEEPVSPRKKLNIFIGAFLGLLSGLFLAFFVNFWNRR